MSTAMHVDLTDLCPNLADGTRLVISHDNTGFTTVHVVPPGCSPHETHGESHNFPTSRSPKTVRDTLDQPGIKPHEIAGIPLNILVTKIIESIPTMTT